MSDCRQGGRAAYDPKGVCRIRVEFAGDEQPWEYPLALNGREVDAVYVDGARHVPLRELVRMEERVAELEGLCRDLDGALGSCAVDAVRGRGCEECEWWDGAKDVCSLAERAVEMGVSAWARAKS